MAGKLDETVDGGSDDETLVDGRRVPSELGNDDERGVAEERDVPAALGAEPGDRRGLEANPVPRGRGEGRHVSRSRAAAGHPTGGGARRTPSR